MHFRGMLAAFCCLILVGLLGSCIEVIHAADKEKIAAKVGDAEISEAMLKDAADRLMPSGKFHTALTPDKQEAYRTDALNMLIETELLFKEAVRRRIPVPDSEIEKIMADNIKRFGSKEKLAAVLEQSSMTEEQLRARIKKIQMVKQLLQGIHRESEPSDARLIEYYASHKEKYTRPESVHLYHIIIKGDPLSPESEWQKKREEAEAILKELKEGKDFAQLAYEKSEDAYRFKSGDVGLLHRGQFEIKDIEDVAFSLKEGELSAVVRSIYGFHILKISEKKPAQTLTLEEAKETIKKELQQKTFDASKAALLDQLKREFQITIYNQPAEKGTAPATPSAK